MTTYTYQYGAGDGELTQVTNPDGSTIQYQYNPTFHEVTQETDPIGPSHHLCLQFWGRPDRDD